MILQDIETMTDAEKLALVKAIQENVASSKAKQVSLETGQYAKLVVDAIKKIKTDLEERYSQISSEIAVKAASIRDGKDGINGAKGEKGDTGLRGIDGANGRDGVDGKDGLDGHDGNGVADARIDFDGSLVITLDNGTEINAGEVVPMDVAEKIKVIGNGGGTSQYVLDAIAALQADIDAISPTLVITDTFVVSSQAAMVALSTAEKGDVAVRTDINKTFILADDPYSTLGNWQELLTPTDAVTSVAGRTGAVTLSTSDISGLGTIATQAANNVAITGGAINGTTIGATTASSGKFTTGLVGANANFTDFPNAQLVGSQANTGSAHIYNIGVAGEGVATDVAGGGQWGVGVYGTGATAGATRGIGIVGDGHCGNTADTAAAIGVRGYATQSHTGGQNIGLYAQATGGASNYALFMASGNIYSAVDQTWAVSDNSTSALSFDASGKAGILKLITTDGSESVSMSGALSVTGVATLGAGAILNTPASGNLANCTFPTLNQNTTGNAATATVATSTPKLLSTNFTIEESGGKLLFKYGATTIASMSSTGVITSVTNIVSNGTP